MQGIVLNGDDGSSQTAGGHHLVSRLQLAQHLLPFLLPPLLGENQKKVKDGKNKDQWGKAQKPQRAATTLHRQ